MNLFTRNSVLVIGTAAAAFAAVNANAQAARNQISIVGSSSVYPFATVAAEQFGRTSQFKTPTVESTGSGGGLKLFCSGIGVATADIVNSSRRIKSSEVENCATNGVTEIVEVKIGYDGIVLANSKSADQMELTTKDIYLALAKNVPNPDGSASFIANPYKNWSDIRAGLPARTIEVLGPPPTSGTRDAFVELAMEGGCKQFDSINAIKAKDEDRYRALCQTIREDGLFVEAGENDNLIVQKLQANPAALGLFGFSFLDQNGDVVQGSTVNGEEPTFENIATGAYPVSRPLYFYAKKAHVGTIPGITEYLAEFTSEKSMGEDGYLADRGLIPLPASEYAEVVAAVQGLKNLNLAAN